MPAFRSQHRHLPRLLGWLARAALWRAVAAQTPEVQVAFSGAGSTAAAINVGSAGAASPAAFGFSSFYGPTPCTVSVDASSGWTVFDRSAVDSGCYATLGIAVQPFQSFSLCTWFYSELGNYFPFLIQSDTGSGLYVSGSSQLGFNVGALQYQVNIVANGLSAEWTHVCGVFDVVSPGDPTSGATVSMYVNGAQLSSVLNTQTALPTAPCASFYLADNQPGLPPESDGEQSFVGLMYQPQIFLEALSPAQVTAGYTAALATMMPAPVVQVEFSGAGATATAINVGTAAIASPTALGLSTFYSGAPCVVSVDPQTGWSVLDRSVANSGCYAALNVAVPPFESFSLCTWFNSQSVLDYPYLIQSASATSGLLTFGNIDIGFTVGAVNPFVNFPANSAEFVWTHICGVFDVATPGVSTSGVTASIYVNGTQAFTSFYATTPATSASDPFYLANNQPGSPGAYNEQSFVGLIYQPQVFLAPLSQAQVTAGYTAALATMMPAPVVQVAFSGAGGTAVATNVGTAAVASPTVLGLSTFYSGAPCVVSVDPQTGWSVLDRSVANSGCYAALNVAVPPFESFSLCTWFNSQSVLDYPYLIQSASATSGLLTFGNIDIGFTVGAVNPFVNFPANSAEFVWTHICGVFDVATPGLSTSGVTASIYVNGTQAFTNFYATTPATSASDPFFVANNQPGSPGAYGEQSFVGLIYQPQVFLAPLSPAQVAFSYTAALQSMAPVPTTPAPSTATATTATPTATPSTATPSTATPSTATATTATATTAAPSTAKATTAAPSTAGPSTSTPSTARPSTAAATTVIPSTASVYTAAASTTAQTTAASDTTAAATTAPVTVAPTNTSNATTPTVPDATPAPAAASAWTPSTTEWVIIGVVGGALIVAAASYAWVCMNPGKKKLAPAPVQGYAKLEMQRPFAIHNMSKLEYP